MSINATTNPATDHMNGRPHQEVRNVALEGVQELVRRLGLRAPRQEPAESMIQMVQANPDLTGKLSRWPDLILSAQDGQDNIHFVAVMTPATPRAEDVRNVRLAASLISESTGRPAHAVMVEMTEEPETGDESWNPVHWHTIVKKGHSGTNGGPQKQE